MSGDMAFGTAVKSLDKMTKDELVEYVRTLEAQRAAVEGEREAWAGRYQEIVQGQAQAQAGYLITTPNPLYAAVTMGVRFERGQAFIPMTREFPEYKPEPVTDLWFEKYGIPPAERAAIRARENTPTATIVANLMRDDFGYVVQYFGPEDKEKVAKEKAVREAEYREALKVAKALENAKKLLTPAFA